MLKFLHSFSITFICFCLPVVLLAQPENDACENAIVLTNSIDVAFTTIDATSGEPYHPTDCTGGVADSLYNDVWYLWTADFTGEAELTTCGTADFDTNAAVYAPGSACPPDVSDLLVCNEDASGCDGFTSSAVFDAVMGETYLLRIGGWGNGSPGEEGSGTFSVIEYNPNPGPDNDDCFTAEVLDLGPMDSVVVAFSTINANTSDPIHNTGTEIPGCLDASEPVPYNDVWWTWTATFTGWVEYSNCGMANFDSKIVVYGPNPTCPPDVESVLACGDDGCASFTSTVSFPVEQDSTYLFRLGGWAASNAGTGTILVHRIAPPVPPENDACMNYDSAWISPFATADDFDPVFEGFTNNGSAEGINPKPTCMQGNEYADTWFKFNSGDNTDLTIRFFKITGTAQFTIDLFDDCTNPTDPVDGPGFCVNSVDSTDFFSIDLSNFPGVGTDYFLRVSTDMTFETPGEFFFQILGEPITNTKEILLENFRLFPNPANDLLNVEFYLDGAKEAQIEIFNTLGQRVQQNRLEALNAGQNRLDFNLSNLQKGIYFFQLSTEEGQKTVKFIKN